MHNRITHTKTREKQCEPTNQLWRTSFRTSTPRMDVYASRNTLVHLEIASAPFTVMSFSSPKPKPIKYNMCQRLEPTANQLVRHFSCVRFRVHWLPSLRRFHWIFNVHTILLAFHPSVNLPLLHMGKIFLVKWIVYVVPFVLACLSSFPALLSLLSFVHVITVQFPPQSWAHRVPVITTQQG